ncbi:MAG: hypothetical protein ACRDU5_01330 [Mycobacterium sp.]
MGEVFIGSEAVATGKLTEYELRRWYQAIFRDIYLPKSHEPSLRDRTVGAWLWSRQRAVVAGVAASALHGAAWVDADAPVELIFQNSRRQHGLIVRNEALADDEITRIAGIPVTTRARTAFDLGRHLSRAEAMARLDALMRARIFSTEDVLLLAKRHPGARGLRQLREVLPMVDGGADSPQETRLRLLFVDAGLPRPTTQIPIVEGRGKLVRMVDMGWEEFMVAAEYDGDQHRTSRSQYVKDLRVLPRLERLGWIVIRVIKEDCDDDIVERARTALASRGWRPDRH